MGRQKRNEFSTVGLRYKRRKTNNIERHSGLTKQRWIFKANGLKVNNESSLVNDKCRCALQSLLQDYKSQSTHFFFYHYWMCLPIFIQFVLFWKAVNTKSDVLINCRKINYQQKIHLLCASNWMDRFKITKPKPSGPKSEKKNFRGVLRPKF